MRNSLWRADDQLATVLYEKTLFFISALFDNRVPKHKTLNEIKWEVYKKTAKVLLLGNFDSEDSRYKMCFATLIREAAIEPD